MARISGRNCFLSVSPLTGCPFNLSGRSNSVTLNIDSEEVEVTAFGALYKERVADALRDWSIECAGFWDGAASNVDATLYTNFAACCAVAFGPAGSGSGQIKYSGCMILQNYTIEGAVDGAVTFSATFQAASLLNASTF